MGAVNRILIWGGTLVVASFSFFVLINLNVFDEDVNPEAAAFARQPKPGFEDKDNAYFALMGFFAPEDREPHAFGKSIVEEYEAALAKNPFLDLFKTALYRGGSKLEIKGKPDALCQVREGGCLSRYLDQEVQVRQLLVDNRVLLERYRLLYSYTHFREIATPSVAEPLPGFSGIGALVNAEIAFLAKRGDTTQALDLLDQDITFWRKVLREGRGLVSKMAATRVLYRDYQMLSDMVNADPGIAKQRHERLEKMTALLSREESGFAECIRNEWAVNFRTSQSMFQAMQEVALYNKLGIQPHATMNDSYRLYKAYADLGAMPASQFPAATKDLRARLESETAWWRMIYNPAGKILTYVAPVDYSTYIARLHDLDGYLRLVALQIQIKSRGIAVPQIADFLRSADKRYADPYTDQPMQWDPKQRLLFFNGLSKRFGKDGVVGVRVD